MLFLYKFTLYIISTKFRIKNTIDAFLIAQLAAILGLGLNKLR